MSIDYQATYAALYTRATTDMDGAAVRALVGQGSVSSIFSRKDLNKLAGKLLPYLVFDPKTVAGASGQMRDCLASWWIYCAKGKGPAPLYEIATALETLYGSASVFDISGGRLGVVFIGSPFQDSALELDGLEVRIGYRRLG